MIQYPLANISKEEWNKKVTATYMYSIPLEDQALPVLEEIVDLLTHLHTSPLSSVIAEEHIEYFFTQVFPPICQKILKSRYFKYISVHLGVLKFCSWQTRFYRCASIWSFGISSTPRSGRALLKFQLQSSLQTSTTTRQTISLQIIGYLYKNVEFRTQLR